MWAYAQQQGEQLGIVAGTWGLLSLQFVGRNGAVLYREFHCIHQELLQQAHIHCKSFAG